LSKPGQRSPKGVELTEKDEGRRESGDNGRVTGLLHDGVHERDREGAENGRERTHADVGHMVVRIRVTNVLEVEVSVETHEPTGEAEEHLCERRMHVEVVLTFDVLCGELAEVHLIEAI
jgi:hypothetical protein